ncbi:hypothetical protein CGLO_05776 [Colletotrichum gloeosporioides Cg-14]|uniref:Amidohydrolase-related domain-containing protein n=1 Tax=Colletotrichum gloeosporioides (strain Cg-14) TaxID=1237896 RepID=T0KQN2_COLGC|nr:hypothetical protein CGLO_05776 [Colletotrichum gloeosporioides Cg-14]
MESPGAAAVQQPPPVHVRDLVLAITRPTSPVFAASLNSSRSATTTLLAEGQEEEGDPSMTVAPIELEVTPLHMLHQPRWIDCPFWGQIHYLESPRSVDVDLEQSRWTWLRDAGAVNSRLILGHFLHPTPDILEEASSAGLKMSWNPISNGRLGPGIADIPKYRRHKLPIGMGVDGEASSDRSDPFENMRVGLYSVRGKYQDPSVLSPQDVFRMHTLGAADVLGVADKVGSLEVGKLADIVLLNPPHMGHLGNPVSAFVFSSGVEDIERVFIGGKEVWRRMPPLAKPTSNWPAWEF